MKKTMNILARGFLLAALSLSCVAGASGVVDKVFVPPGAGSVARSINAKIADVSVNVRDFGAKCDGATDDKAAIQAALNVGGRIELPKGTCKVTGPLDIKIKTILVGTGRHSSTLQFTHTGDGIRSTWPLNTSTAVWIAVRDLEIINSNGANTGGGFVDVGGTFVDLSNVSVSGFKHQMIFDQTEIFSVANCEITSGITGGTGIWLVNGADHTPGAAIGFTNRAAIVGNQFNSGPAALANIAIDGGGSHSIRDNNFNAGGTGVRAAGVGGLILSGNESEGHTSDDFNLTDTTLAGGYVGPVQAPEIIGNTLTSLGVGQNISAGAVVGGHISGNVFGQASAAINFVNGASNKTSGIVIEGNGKITRGNGLTPGPFFAGFSRSTRQNFIRQAAATYSTAAASAGTAVITPATMEAIRVGTRLHLFNADGTGSEDTIVTAATGSTFTAALASAKTAGFQIYGATQSDQEEGTWTPTLGAASVNGSHTYSVQSGQYSRRGNLVHVKGVISISAKDASMSGALTIRGLPFVAEGVTNGNAYASIGGYSGITMSAGYSQITGIISPAGNTIDLRKSGSGVALNVMPATDIPGTTVDLLFDAVYTTNSL